MRRNLWNPSNENESYRPYRPARLKTGAWTGGPYYCVPAAQRLAGKRRPPIPARVFGALPPAARTGRTWDNGSESALHLLVDESTGMPAYPPAV